MKTCSRCNIERPISDFGKSSKAKDGLQWHCRQCKAELHRQNHSDRMASIKASKNKRVEASRDFIVEYLQSHPCVDCENSDIRVLEFDHVRGDKVNGVGRLVQGGYRLEVIKEEVAKCDVRCRNCHAIKTYERMGGSWHDRFVLPL